MRTVRCYECGKVYDYNEDGFCPWCGCFNQPAEGRSALQRRVDGLSESGHSGSFLHREFHQEERQRRRSGLDAEKKPGGQRVWQEMQKAVSAVGADREGGSGKKKPAQPAAMVARLVWGLILLSIILNTARACMFNY